MIHRVQYFFIHCFFKVSVGLLLFIVTPLSAQQALRWAMKAGASLPYNLPTLAWEYRIGKRHGIEIQWLPFRYKAGQLPELFSGSFVTQYAEISIDSSILNAQGNVVSNRNTVSRIGDVKRSYLSGTYAIRAFSWRVGWRIYMRRKTYTPWKFWQQPGFTLTQWDWYEVNNRLFLTQERLVRRYIMYERSLMRITKTSRDYDLIQNMEYKTRLIPGIEYNVGVPRRFGRHFLAELRVNSLLNPNVIIHSETLLPLRFFQTTAQLHLGWWL